VTTSVYRYEFSPASPLSEIEQTLVAAIQATESLHGESQVRLELHHLWDAASRCCVISAETEIGVDLNRIFVGNLRRNFGDDSFTVRRIRE